MSLSDAPIGAAVTDGGTGQPVITVNTTTSLTVALVNRSGADIELTTGAKPATFGVYLPVPKLFTLAQLQQMQLTTSGWQASVDAGRRVLNVACAQAATWAQGQTLKLTIANVTSGGPPATGTVTIAPSNMAGNVPLSVGASLAVANPPKPGNLSLPDVLQMSLDSQGSVYRSDSSDPLTNTLFLNLKNIGAGPMATGGPPLPGAPQILVSFVYGNTSGALAPDAGGDAPPLGSAWNIKLAMGPAQAAWTGANPRWDNQQSNPQWVLKPTDPAILGPAGTDKANVTFAFSNIISLTPTGHTQMLALCTGFAKDASTRYDDHLYVLDIVKQDAPPTRGLLSFFAPEPIIAVTDSKANVDIPLRWTMFDGVASVQLITSAAAVAPFRTSYPDPQPLAYDQATVTVPPLRTSEAIFATLQAFDGAGAYLNGLQFTAYADVRYVVDPGGHVYSIALIGDTFWMLQNYGFETADGSHVPPDDPHYQGRCGRLYELKEAQASAPQGWALPDVDDWNALIARYGGSKGAFTALKAGGPSGFGAQLGGWRTDAGDYESIDTYGYYWASEGHVYAQFSQPSETLTVGATVDPKTALSVRYVRHA